MWQVLNIALEAARDTDGLFDPTILPALEAAGYRKTFAEVAGQQPETMDLPESRPDWRDIKLNPVTHTVTLPLGTRIDLGDVAKSWTAQSAVGTLAALGPALVGAGAI